MTDKPVDADKKQSDIWTKMIEELDKKVKIWYEDTKPKDT